MPAHPSAWILSRATTSARIEPSIAVTGVVVACLALLTLSSSGAAAEDSATLAASASASSGWTGGAVTAVEFNGGVAWTVIGTRVVAFDLSSDPPRRMGSSDPLPEVAEDLALGEGVAVVATRGVDGGAGMVHVVDISDPHSPTVLGAAVLDHSRAREVGGVGLTSDGRLALLVTEKGLSIVDVSVPAEATEIAWLKTGDRVRGGTFEAFDWEGDVVAAPDGIHALVARPWGLYSVFVGDGSAPYLALDADQSEDPSHRWRSMSIALDRDVAWLVDASENALVALDVRDAALPRELGRSSIGSGGRAVAAADGRVMVLDQDGTRIASFDATDPARPVRIGDARVDIKPDVHSRMGLAGSAGPALIAIGSSGLHRVDGIVGSSRLHRVDELEGDGDRDSDDSRDGLTVSRIESVIPPLQQLLIDDLSAFGAAGPSGIAVLDFGDPRSPRLVERTGVRAPSGMPAGVYALSRVDDTLYALTDDAGLVAFDLIDDVGRDAFDLTDSEATASMTRREGPAFDALGAVPGRRRATTLDRRGHELAFADGAGDVRIVDVHDPDEPRLIAHVPGDFKDVVFSGDLLYAIDMSIGFGRLSVIEREEMGAGAGESEVHGSGTHVRALIDLPRPFQRLFADAGRLYLSGEPSSAALGIMSLDDPLAPRLLALLDGTTVGRPMLDGRQVLAADRARLQRIELDDAAGLGSRDASLPLAWGRSMSDDGPSDIHRMNDRVIVTRGSAGLFSMEWPRSEAVAIDSSAGNLERCAPPAHLALVIDSATPNDLRFAIVEAAVDIGLGVASFGSQAERHADVESALGAFARMADVDPIDEDTRFDLALAAAEHELRAALGAVDAGGAVLIVSAGLGTGSGTLPDRAHAAAMRRAVALRGAGAAVHVMAVGTVDDPDPMLEIVGDPARYYAGVDGIEGQNIVRAVASGGCPGALRNDRHGIPSRHARSRR